MRSVLRKVIWGSSMRGSGYCAKKEFIFLLVTLKDFKDPLTETRETTHMVRSMLQEDN